MKSKEALEEIQEHIVIDRNYPFTKAQKNINIIKKDLEVLEIIKNKLVFPLALMSLPYEEYNYTVLNPEQQLTQEEYDKIKGRLRDE